MASIDLSAESLDRLEAQLTADLEAVRRIRALLSGHQPASVPVASIAALLPAAAPAATPPAASGAQSALPAVAPPAQPYIPPPHHPQMDIRDVNVAVREVVATLDGAFGIGDVKKQLRVQHYREFGDGSIRTVLQKMQAQGELSLSSQGLGRAGNKYSRNSAS